jgi:hypothetical protein
VRIKKKISAIAPKTIVISGRFPMNYTLRRADRVTHLKIVVVALVAVVAVIAVGLNARKNDLVAQGPTNGVVIKAGQQPATYAGQEGSTTR